MGPKHWQSQTGSPPASQCRSRCLLPPPQLWQDKVLLHSFSSKAHLSALAPGRPLRECWTAVLVTLQDLLSLPLTVVARQAVPDSPLGSPATALTALGPLTPGAVVRTGLRVTFLRLLTTPSTLAQTLPAVTIRRTKLSSHLINWKLNWKHWRWKYFLPLL